MQALNEELKRAFLATKQAKYDLAKPSDADKTFFNIVLEIHGQYSRGNTLESKEMANVMQLAWTRAVS